jgi:hypothetical protein
MPVLNCEDAVEILLEGLAEQFSSECNQLLNELNALGRTHLEGQQVAWARAPERSSTGQHKGEEQHPGYCQFGQAEDSKMLHL